MLYMLSLALAMFSFLAGMIIAQLRKSYIKRSSSERFIIVCGNYEVSDLAAIEGVDYLWFENGYTYCYVHPLHQPEDVANRISNYVSTL